MLRVQFHDETDLLRMRIEGRFVAQFAEELRDLISRRRIPSRFIVDVSDVIFVDDTGEAVLSWLGRLGANFVAESAYSCDVCERLRLLLVVQPDLQQCSLELNTLLPAACTRLN